MSSQSFTTIYRTKSDFNLKLIKLKLEEKDIPCLITNEKIVDVLPFLSSELELKVSNQHVELAIQVISIVDIDNLEYDLISANEYSSSDIVKEDKKYFVKAIFISIIVVSLIVTYKYLKLY